ncbi:MAG: GHKL domain-containing protein [Bacteroidetes bacterium]|nr:MAG: GHKL domain-containing protein [Bacteroidota bacterium]
MKKEPNHSWVFPLIVLVLGVLVTAAIYLKLQRNYKLAAQRVVYLERERTALNVWYGLMEHYEEAGDCFQYRASFGRCLEKFLPEETLVLYDFKFDLNGKTAYIKNTYTESDWEDWFPPKRLEVSNKVVEFYLKPTREHIHILTSEVPSVILWSGLSLSAVLSLLIYTAKKYYLKNQALKLAETKIKAASARLYDFMNASSAIFTLWDDAFCLLEINEAGLRLFGKKKEELLSRHITEVIPPLTADTFEYYRKKFENHDSFELIHLYKTDGLSDRYFKTKVFRMKTGYGILNEDITRLRKYNQLLQQKNKELEEYMYAASHDLQEPLNTISGFVEILREELNGQLDDENIRQYFDFITSASSRMKSLIQALLTHSRIGKNKKIEWGDTRELVNDALKDLHHAIEKSGAEIEVPEEMPVIQGYRLELKLLFQNLLSNAIKYKRSGVPPRIRIGTRQREEGWQFCIEDNGIGIDPQYKERIFKLFQRLHNKKTYEGYGIGLAHCKKIIELHHGTIWVDSEKNKGSTFHFIIPFEILKTA